MIYLQVNPDQIIRAGGNPCDEPDCGEHAIATCLAGKFEALVSTSDPCHNLISWTS